MNQNEQFNFEKLEKLLSENPHTFINIDYPPIQTVLQNFDQDFIQGLPFLDENFISNILNDIS